MYIIHINFNEFPGHSIAPNLINTLASVRLEGKGSYLQGAGKRTQRSKPTNIIPYDQHSEGKKNGFAKSVQKGLPGGGDVADT